MSKKHKARKPAPSVPAAEPAEPTAAAESGAPLPAPASPRTSRLSLSTWLVFSGVLASVVFVVFANSLPNGFVFDDIDLVVTEDRIQDLSRIRSSLTESYRPLRTITYALDYAIWGLNPAGFRLTNLIIHMVNCALVFRLSWRLTAGARHAALVAALIFAVHPVQVESVAYISGRRDVLFAFFYLAGFLSYIRFREAVNPRERIGWLAMTGAGFAFSLMSKEMAASLPIACVLWDLHRTAGPDSNGERPAPVAALKRMLREGAVLYAIGVTVLVAFAYYTLVIRRATTLVAGTDVEFWGGSLLNNTLTVALTYAHYAKLTVWPVTLSAQYYGAFDPADGLTDPRVVPAILFLFGLIALSLVLLLKSKWRVAGFGLAWALVTLLPASQIIPHHEIVADHYLYLPLAGVGLVAAEAVRMFGEASGVTESRRRAVYAAAAAVIVLLAGRTVARNTDWKDETTLWQATYRAVPQSPRAAYNYGLALTNKGDGVGAAKYYQEAIKRDPTFVVAYRNLAATYATQGRFDEAKIVWRSALQSDIEKSARTWHMDAGVLKATYEIEIAILEAQTGQTEKARDAMIGICLRFPDLLRAQDALATVLQMRGEVALTVDIYRQRVEQAPDNIAQHLILANLLWKTGRIDEANELFARVRRLNEYSSMANLYLARYAREIKPGQIPDSDVDALFTRAERSALTPFDAETVQKFRHGGAGTLSGG